jgi:RNA polymerase sigma-70 factor (ECF subfamily)
MAAALRRNEADLALAHRVLAGDEEAMEALFARSFAALCRFALVRVGGDEALAEELAQATLCRALDKLGNYRGEAAMQTWLCTICQNLVADHYARLGRRPPELSLGEEDPHLRAALAALAVESAGPEEQLGRREVARRVQATLGALPPRYAEALSWKYVQGLSVTEIGERLELSAKAAESLLSRARQAFRQSFGGLATEEGRR